MKIGFRVDASINDGTGHVMRCLTLADELRELGAEVFFMCRRRPGDLVEFIQNQGYPVYEMTGADQVSWEEDAVRVIQILDHAGVVDWLVVDNYELDARWEKAIRPHVKKLMVIDDLADRPHDCDLLLDQNLYKKMEVRYTGLVPERATLLLGPAYTLLRREFLQASPLERERDGTVRRILVSFGGSDPTNETLKTLQAIERLEITPEVDVVIGESHPYKQAIIRFCDRNDKMELHIQTKEMARHMECADLAIGAGGSSVWERCYMELPSLIIETAPNQTEVISSLLEKGAIFYLGKSAEVNVEHLSQCLAKLMGNPSQMKNAWASVKEVMKNHKRYGVSKLMMGGAANG
ncbi:UDP-2,4-diacetamido-2,4,6-trideoxy-beta-L-altropyranose hydrolase [Halobacillus dabanensis]|uniref:UDP-2,4-diacetamido-2,4,6-trideoxy-beta-L-altropyranose hydrolase n=1 Tax=Halobacillus dabanensis TaxID=240302 RepID=A0A1I3U4F9_HALDA|nr:UDP-2,4-diacetamido-2,4,6-trideoxy-beta-L-altropyranose hydrolase [Halobacillus dabanensis]SFJ77633.1 UDP-2,4-diacetamido-2,4,6-trideoxy-beta-L-altropyranose hydrolase [Halobacillus dabanensis]